MNARASRAATILLADARAQRERRLTLSEQLELAANNLRACAGSVFLDAITPNVLDDARAAARQAIEALDAYDEATAPTLTSLAPGA